MLTRKLFKLINHFSKIKINDILSRSYNELVDLVAQKYGNKEFNHPNTAALYQIQHQFKIVEPGDWVLDIGAGPDYRWSQLALGLAENQEQTHRVVSNDKIDCRSLRPNQLFVRGDFCEEQIRTKIGLKLQSNKFNTILVDASPEYTGNLDEDGEALANIVQHALYFSNLFLQKGGNFVCKVLHCSSTNLLEETGKYFFNEAHVFKPSVIRTKSPVHFLVFKGFAMSHNLQALREFLNRYRGSPKNKIEVVKSYQNKYNWDPIKVIRNKIKNDIIEQKMCGRSTKEIEKMYESDPFLNIGKVMKQLRKIQIAEASNDEQMLKKAINAYSEGKLFHEFAQVPTNRQEWITFIQEMQAQAKSLKKPEKKKQNLQPLKDNQVYMKNEQIKTPESQPFIYLQQDLTGQYENKCQQAFIQREIQKLNSVLKTKDGKQFKSQHFTGKQKFNLEDEEGKYIDYSELSKPLSEMAEEMRHLSDQQFKEELEKEGYDEQSQSFITKSVKSNRNKFRNR